MNYEELAKLAIEAKKTALPKYSQFHVGAALLTEEGKVYLGGNIETSSYSLTICAERTALFKAISEGERNFKAVAVASDDPGYCPPCGACRQVLKDLCGNIDVIMVNGKGGILVKNISELIPLAFGDENLKDAGKSN